MSSQIADGGARVDGRQNVTTTSRVRRTYTEARNGFKTSEFYLTLAFVIAVLVAAYVKSDTLTREQGWRYAAIVAAAYIVSRGFAKLGTREPYTEDDRR